MLPRLGKRHRTYPRCKGLVHRFIFGNYAFVTVQREDPKHDVTADFLYGIDLTKGVKARWRGIYVPTVTAPAPSASHSARA